MKPTLTQLSTLAAISAALCSCDITRQRVDYSWFRDTMTAPQEDSVTVEAGSGITEATALQPATTGTAPEVLPPVTAAAPAPAAPTPAIPAYTPEPLAQQTENERSWWWPFNQKQNEAQAPAPVTTYTVQSGDTLSVIARRHGVSLSSVIQANNMTSEQAHRLSIGQVLTIPTRATAPTAAAPPVATPPPAAAPAPVATPAPAPAAALPPGTTAGIYYTVRQGDTLSTIARRYNTTIAKIMQANNMTAEQAHRLSIGQKILLPRN